MYPYFRCSAALIGFFGVVTAILCHADDQTSTTIYDKDWGRMGSFAGVNRYVKAIASWKDTLYVGGDLSFAGTDSVRNIVRWDGTQWGSMGAGLNGTVYSLAVDSSGVVYASGSFDSAGGIHASSIAKWENNQWSPLGEGTNLFAGVLVFDNRSGILYMGGFVVDSSGFGRAAIAKWDGSTWKAFDSVPNTGYVTALTLDTIGNLYAGIGQKIFAWNGKEWTEFSTEKFYFKRSSLRVSNKIDGMVYDERRKLLYAVGESRIDSSNADGSRTYYDGFLFKWDGSDWSMVGSCSNAGSNPPFIAVRVPSVVCDNNGNLYIGGHFSAGNNCCIGDFNGTESLLKWNGNSWNMVAKFLRSDGMINALHSDGSGNLYMGGWFLNLDSVTAKSIIKYSNGSFTSLGYDGVGLPVNELAFDKNGTLWAQRLIFKYGRQSVEKETVRKDGNAWNLSPVSPLLIGGKIIEYDDTIGSGITPLLTHTNTVISDGQGTLLAGGSYDSSKVLKKWDGSVWTNITGMSNTHNIYAIAFDKEHNLYIAGDYLEVGNGSQFHSVNPPKLPKTPPVSAAHGTRLCYDSANGIMYGDYRGTTWINSQTTPYTLIFKWGADSVEVISPLITGEVKEMICGPDGSLYIGGVFDTIGSLKCNNLAKWDGEAWSALGSGTDKQYVSQEVWYESVLAMTLQDSLLYVGGSFLTAGGRLSPYLANVNILGTGNTPIAGKPRQNRSISPAIGLRRHGNTLYFSNLVTDDRIQLHTLSGRLLSDTKGVPILPLHNLSCQVLIVTVLRGNKPALSANISVY